MRSFIDAAASPQTRPLGPHAYDEATLVTRAQEGDSTAFDALFTRYHRRIYSLIYQLMLNATDAEELTQDTFLKAWLGLEHTKVGVLHWSAWLYRIATNVCLDELRHRQLVKWTPWEAFISTFHPSQVAQDNPEQDCLAREEHDEVQIVLGQLHPRHRLLLVLREFHDLTYDEIGEVLNLTHSAIKSLLFRARTEFRKAYEAGAAGADASKKYAPTSVRDPRATTRARVRAAVRAVLSGHAPTKQVARRMGVSDSHLYLVLAGRASPGLVTEVRAELARERAGEVVA